MTAEIVDRIAKEHNISQIRAMVLIHELLGSKKPLLDTGAK